ncbi:MFS transporter [Gluconacetobacter sacchari]|uniref:MFS transporter n=1 Tax=Gluconacetobacter sacchari TaxID=92759 RepID=UPI0039B69ED7
MLFLAYLFDVLDRTNIGMASLTMTHDLGMSAQGYGIAIAAFFLGYILFEIPSALYLARVGARDTLLRIMLLWGLTCVATAFVPDARFFYPCRFLLGAFQAGFVPACICYIALWYPPDRLPGALAIQQAAGPIAGIVGAPLSGLIMDRLDRVAGLAGWRWMLLLEALPVLLLAYGVLRLCPTSPATAAWLTPDERALPANPAPAAITASPRLRDLMRDSRLQGFAVSYFCLICGIYTLAFWAPKLLAATGLSTQQVGLCAAVPGLAAICGSLAWARYTERRPAGQGWHVAVPAALGAALLGACGAEAPRLPWLLTLLALSSAALYAAYIVFWGAMTRALTEDARPVGSAYVTMFGLMGGLVSPLLVGHFLHATGSHAVGLSLVGTIGLLGAMGLAAFFPRTGFAIRSTAKPIGCEEETIIRF